MSQASPGSRRRGAGRRRTGAHSAGAVTAAPGPADGQDRPPGGRAAARKGRRKQGGGRRALKIVGMVMSVPRDLRADWSGCHDDGHANMGPQHDVMINAALAGGPGWLIGLGTDLNKVPTDRITFATLQTADTKVHGVYETHLVDPGAAALFKTIAQDQSLTTAGGGKAKPSATPTIPPSSIAVQVQNGTTVNGRAGAIAKELLDRGFSHRTSSGDGPSSTTTSLAYPAGEQAQAQSVAKALGIPSKALKQSASGTGIVLLLGADWPTGTTFPGGKAAASDADKKSALDGANSQLGSEKGHCAPVSRFTDVIGVDGSGHVTTAANPPHSTSPTHAYAISPTVKDSAP